MDQILDLPASSEKDFKYAGFWIRVAAFLIDLIILSILNFGIILFSVGDMSSTVPDINKVVTAYAFLFVANALYFIVMHSSVKQATVGKMAVGIRVGNSKGEQISFLNALGRFFAVYLSCLIFYIGLMMAGWDRKKQSLHDKLANTYVYYA